MFIVEQHAKFYIMISGGIFMGGRTELDIHDRKDGNIDHNLYKRTLIKIYEPCLIEHNLTFQQDGARMHTCKEMQDYFKTVRYAVMYWSSISPDLSPIELMWKILKDELRKHIITSHE